MTPFLKQVADLYYNEGGMERKFFIFPNRRSIVFFRKYLCEAVAREGQTPMLMPQMMTINDFFYKLAQQQTTDRVRLLLKLYECYSSLNNKHESLDDFIFWGDIILADFNDIDKYLVDAKQLFTNVADYKELQDTFDYLSEVQRAAIESFLSHFNDQSGRLTTDLSSDNPDVKARFLQIWNILYPLYVNFNLALEAESMAYEGMVHRKVAQKLESQAAVDLLAQEVPDARKLVFVGLNALNECEKMLLRKFRDSKLAEFCWDWSGKMIQDPMNRSSFFMSENVLEFPQKEGLLTIGNSDQSIPEINVLSVASAVGQAKRLPDLLRRLGGQADECAVVLPDENLLRPVLNSIPEEVEDINVTMGLPMSGSRFYSLMGYVSAIQLHLLSRAGKWMFYHKQAWDLFSEEIFRKASGEEAMKKVEKIKDAAKYYIPQEDFQGEPILETVFRPVITDPKAASREQIAQFAEYQKDVIKKIAASLVDDNKLALELEYAKEYYKCVNILQEIGLEVLPITYIRLLNQLLSGVSLPFNGEPLKGLQIMGPLETRALDFRNLIIMSSNEGTFPRRNVSSSFIPPELRRGFGLPTYEFQDAVWAYYFYRMISRAETVWMVVDSRTEGLKSGEESRYIKQLEYHFRLPIKRYVAKFEAMAAEPIPEIEKTAEDVEIIKNTSLSATTLQNYLACPAKFYYGTIKRLSLEEDVAESLDYGMFGTVFHETMQNLYSVNDKLSRSYLKECISNPKKIKLIIKQQIMEQLHTIEVSGRNLVVTDVILRYVLKTLERDLEILERAGKEEFEILGLEKKCYVAFEGQKFKGTIDRLDSLGEGNIRVVDYKTGKVLDEDENIEDATADAIVEKIFDPNIKERPKIALQFFIYDMLLRSEPEAAGRGISNSVYSSSKLFKEAPAIVPLNQKFYDKVSEKLKELLEEMYDTEKPFRRTEQENNCTYCDFKVICGR